MNKSLYFIYLFNNYFCLSYIDLNDSFNVVKLRINEDENNINEIYNFFTKNQIRIGYKNHSYESKIRRYILDNYEQMIDEKLSPLDICKKLCIYSCSISDEDSIPDINEIDLNKIYSSTRSLNSLSNKIYTPNQGSRANIQFDLNRDKWDDFNEFCTRNILEIRLFYNKVFNEKIINNERIKIDLLIKDLNKNKQSSLF